MAKVSKKRPMLSKKRPMLSKKQPMLGKKLLKVLVGRSLEVPVLQERITKTERRIALLEDGLMPGKRRTRIQVWRSRGGLGDIVMQSIIAKGLKQMWPECHITYAVPEEYMDIPRHNPFVDEVTAVKAPYYEDGYDYSVKLSDPCPAAVYEAIHNPDIKRTRIDLFLSQSKVRLSDKHLVYEVAEEEREWAKEFLKGNQLKIGFALHAAEKWRDWPIENFHRLADMLDASIFIFDKDVHNSWLECDGVSSKHRNIHNICGFELYKVAALVEQLDLLIGPDSGLLHLAGALDIPIIGLFGPTDPLMRIADYKDSQWVWLKDDCEWSPCWYNPCAELKCLKKISPEMVFEKIKAQLKSVEQLKSTLRLEPAKQLGIKAQEECGKVLVGV